MLNKDNQRELAYIVKIDQILPHNNADRLEIAVVNGWRIIVGKGDFVAGDLAIYFEIDSKLPEKSPWTEMEFLASKHFKIKTQKIRGELSQGFLVSPETLGWVKEVGMLDDVPYLVDKVNNKEYKLGSFLTEVLGVTYSVAEDNKRKANSSNKYAKMAQRNVKFAKTKLWKWLYKRDWGKKLLFTIFGRRSDKSNSWPNWVQKTDEERVENMSYILNNKEPWIATEKIDGTSTTFTARRFKNILGFEKIRFFVCSRNICFDSPEKEDKLFYDQNYYTKMAYKYNVESVLKDILNRDKSLEWVTIQGETFGKSVQNRDYSMKDVDFRAFNFIDSNRGRWNSYEAQAFLIPYKIPWVPIVNTSYILPNSIEELREFVDSQKSVIDGKMREGIVFRAYDGVGSFKCVSPEYLLKYHNG